MTKDLRTECPPLLLADQLESLSWTAPRALYELANAYVAYRMDEGLLRILATGFPANVADSVGAEQLGCLAAECALASHAVWRNERGAREPMLKLATVEQVVRATVAASPDAGAVLFARAVAQKVELADFLVAVGVDVFRPAPVDGVTVWPSFNLDDARREVTASLERMRATGRPRAFGAKHYNRSTEVIGLSGFLMLAMASHDTRESGVLAKASGALPLKEIPYGGRIGDEHLNVLQAATVMEAPRLFRRMASLLDADSPAVRVELARTALWIIDQALMGDSVNFKLRMECAALAISPRDGLTADFGSTRLAGPALSVPLRTYNEDTHKLPYSRLMGLLSHQVDDPFDLERSGRVVTALAQAGVFVDCTGDAVGNTPLMLAAQTGLMPAARALVLAGADPWASRPDGGTAAQFARNGGHLEMCAFFDSVAARNAVTKALAPSAHTRPGGP